MQGAIAYSRGAPLTTGLLTKLAGSAEPRIGEIAEISLVIYLSQRSGVAYCLSE